MWADWSWRHFWEGMIKWEHCTLGWGDRWEKKRERDGEWNVSVGSEWEGCRKQARGIDSKRKSVRGREAEAEEAEESDCSYVNGWHVHYPGLFVERRRSVLDWTVWLSPIKAVQLQKYHHHTPLAAPHLTHTHTLRTHILLAWIFSKLRPTMSSLPVHHCVSGRGVATSV